MKTPKIGLNMIVKNESHVIEKLIRHIAKYLSTWTIVDTGSTDNTTEIIESTFSELGIKGTLHHRPWIDFGTNRSEALSLAAGSCDYHWVIDADDWVQGEIPFCNLGEPSYHLKFGSSFTYYRQQLFKDGFAWRYVGVLHEYPTCDQSVNIGKLTGDYFIESRRLGARNQDPNKYLNDAKILEDGIKNEPDNPRYWFYLGQSYYDAQVFDKAIRAYKKRVTMNSWDEEVFYSQLKIGMCLIKQKAPIDQIIFNLLHAYQLRAKRAESLYELAFYLRMEKQYDLAAMFADQAAHIDLPDDILFVDAAVYSYKALDELSVSGYYSANLKLVGFQACKELVAREDLPDDIHKRAIDNLEHYRKIGFES